MPTSGIIGAENTGVGSELLREFCISVVKRFAEDFDAVLKAKETRDETSDKSEDGLSILEVESNGVSCIRYANEVVSIRKVYASHSREDEVTAVTAKILSEGADKLIETVCETPLMSLYRRRKHSQRCQVVDLTAVPDVVTLLDAAVQCVADGGLLLVKFTDSALFSASDSAACYRRYGATNVDGSRESALRVGLVALELHANRNGRVTMPLASQLIGDELLVCVRLFIGPVRCKQSLSKTSLVFHCETCKTSSLHALGQAELISEKPQRFKFSLARGPPVPALCQRCQQPHQVGGPVWNAELQDADFTSRLAPLIATGSSEAVL